MHRNELFLLLACATVVAAMAGNPPTLSRSQVDLAALFPSDASPGLALTSAPHTLDPGNDRP